MGVGGGMGPSAAMVQQVVQQQGKHIDILKT